MNKRVARYLTGRLRREAARELIHIAVDQSVLEEHHLTIDGRDIWVYRKGVAAEAKPHPAILRDLRRASGLTSGSSVDAKGGLEFDADTKVPWIEDEANAEHPEPDHPFEELAKRPQEDRAQVVRLVAWIRSAAMPPKAAEVATALMIANALEADGELGRLQRVLQLPQPIISVRAAVDGFAKIFADLLRRGLILPGKVALSDGYRNYLDALPNAAETRWHAVHFQMDAQRDELEDASVYRKASHSLPLLFVGEGAFGTPTLLECASQIELDCGCLTENIVRETIGIVLGKSPASSTLFPAVGKLGLEDLALAIRPEMEEAQALAALHRLAEYANRDTEQDAAAKDVEDRTSARGSSTSKSGTMKKSSGNEVIQPAPLDGDRGFVPTLDTLAGFDAARDWALNLKEDLHLWRAHDLPWDDMSTKLLLSGPPGTGKTTFACALCNSLRVPLVVTSVATWLEPGYLGDCLKRMSKAFEEARSLAPCILFIDEFDGISSRGRSARYDDYWTTIINRLLELLDGASKSTGVVVVAATNNPSVIDAALLRSGRLEKHIAIPMPDVAALSEILRHHLGNDLHGVIATAPSELSAQKPCNVSLPRTVTTAARHQEPRNDF
jgi:ATPase family associated with various cellular activities (AAA)